MDPAHSRPWLCLRSPAFKFRWWYRSWLYFIRLWSDCQCGRRRFESRAGSEWKTGNSKNHEKSRGQLRWGPPLIYRTAVRKKQYRSRRSTKRPQVCFIFLTSSFSHSLLISFQAILHKNSGIRMGICNPTQVSARDACWGSLWLLIVCHSFGISSLRFGFPLWVYYIPGHDSSSSAC